MKAKIGWMLAPVVVLGLLAVSVLPGCEVGSPNDVVATANGNFSGTYAASSNDVLVVNNSGNAVTYLVLTQSGNQLQAVDNNGLLFKGTIGDILSTSSSGSSTNSTSSTTKSASFTLNGSTTAGQTVNINGTLSASGSTGRMTGIWSEPGVYGSIAGTASITAF